MRRVLEITSCRVLVGIALQLRDQSRAFTQRFTGQLLYPVADLGGRDQPDALLETHREVPCARVTPLRIAVEAFEHNRIELSRDVGAVATRRHDGIVEHTHQHVAWRGPVKETPVRQHLPQHDRRCPYVSAALCLSLKLFWGRVAQLAFHLAFATLLQPLGRFRDAKVEHACQPIGTDQNVLRRHVAMHDTQRLAARALGIMRRMKTVE